MTNTTNASDLSISPNIRWEATPTVTQTVIFFSMAIITVLGNGLVILVVVKDPFKELRTISNYLVVNLAIADLLLGLIAEPLWGMDLWIRSAQYRKAALSVMLTSTNATSLNVLAMSVERYLVLRAGLRYQSILTHKRLAGCIVAIWVVSLIIALLPLIEWIHLPIYLLVTADVIQIPALIVTIIMYILIFRVLKSSKPSTFGNRQAITKVRLRQRRVAKTVFVVIVVYAICWIPSLVSGNIAFTCGSRCITQQINNFINLLVLANSFTNPIIYAFKMPKFRAAAKFLLQCRCILNQNQSTPDTLNRKANQQQNGKWKSEMSTLPVSEGIELKVFKQLQ